ncbi:MAG: transcriptional regulator MntR [Thaumarchaeota archaeon]|nr:transcriptional regulator MntR [Nitrososphaerota archaeon]
MPRGTRRKQETPRAEDYLETVYHLIEDKGYANTVELSDKLKVKPPTVSSMIGKLASRGYLLHEPYRGMKLTESGEKIARSVIRRHEIISEFLSMIGVEGDIAYEDTEGIEHHVQPTTIYRIERLVEFLRRNPAHLAEIKKYVST